MEPILHITTRKQWEDAKRAGGYQGDTLASDGFIHCSTFKQLVRVANALFRGASDLVLLVIEPSKVRPEIRWEGQEGGPAFPHIYGQLNCDAVVDVLAFDPKADGLFELPNSVQATLAAEGATVVVRIAGPNDLAQCKVQDPYLPSAAVGKMLNEGNLLVAELDGVQVGYLRLEYLWSKVPYIGLIRIQDGYRRQGIGKSMFNFLEDHLSGRGHDRVFSSSQADEPEPQAWHRHMGFEECGIISGINEGGIGEVFFCKRLTKPKF